MKTLNRMSAVLCIVMLAAAMTVRSHTPDQATTAVVHPPKPPPNLFHPSTQTAQHPAGASSEGEKGNKTTYPFITIMNPQNTRAYLLDVELADLYGVYFGAGDQIADSVVRNYGVRAAHVT